MGRIYMDGSFELLDGAHVSKRLLLIFKARHGSLAGCSYTSNGIEFDDAPFEAEEIIDAIAGARNALGIIITGYGHWYNSDGEEGSFEVDAAGNVKTYDADQWALHCASDEELMAELSARGFTISHASKKAVVAKKKTESNAIVNELIRAMCPYADDDRLFKAVDALRVFVAQQNNFIDTLFNSETAKKKE